MARAILDRAISAAGALAERVLALAGGGGQTRHLLDVLGGGVVVMAIRIAGAGLAYLSLILLVRWMGTFEFGVYAYVWSGIMLASVLLPLGLSSSLMRFVPEYQTRGFGSRLSGVILQSRRIVALAASIAALAAAGAMLALADIVPGFYVLPVLVALAALPMLAMIDLYIGLARAFGWAGLAYGPFYVLQPFLLIATMGLMVLFGVSPTAVTALALMVLCVSVTLAVLVARVSRGMRDEVSAAPPRMHTRYWLAISLPLLLMESFRALLEQTDILAIGAIMGPEDVAVYFAALRTAGVIGFAHFAVAALAVPKIARIHNAGTSADMQRFVGGVIHLAFWPSLIGAAGLVVLGPFLLALFDPGFAVGYPALVILVGSFLVRAAAGPVEFMLNMTGHQGTCARILALAAAVNLILNLALIPPFGITGAAVATALATVLNNAMLVVAVRRRLGVTCLLGVRGAPAPAAQPR